MNLNSALNSGVQGISSGMEGMAKAADAIARQAAQPLDTDLADLAESAVDLQLNKFQVEASAKVVQTVSDSVGSLLDIRA